MDILLREVRSGARSFEEQQDTEVSATELTLGAAPDQMIQLIGSGIAPKHAVLRQSGTNLVLQCRRGCRVTFGGRDVRKATLTTGDSVSLGGHTLTLFEPPPGFDVAIELRVADAAADAAYQSAYRTSLEQTWLGKRASSWTLLAVVLAAGLLVPLALLTWHGDRSATAWQVLPTDQLWSTGPLLPAHAVAIGNDCSACHTKLFQRVQDQQCLTCHATTHDHLHADLSAALDYQPPRCAACHREHHAPPALVITADRLCTDCHADPGRFAPHAELDVVTGFSMTTHAPFVAHLLKPVVREGGTGLLFDWRIVREPAATGVEASNLKFPHDVHLDPARVRKLNDDSVLGCIDCHRLSADREHFEPVTMDRHCRACHELKFDPSEPERELPHGQPVEVVLALEGHFMRKFGNPQLAAEPPPRRRVPNRDDTRDRCTDGVFQCASRATLSEAVNQFTRRGCVTCHVVEDSGRAEIYTRFQVHPVRLVTDYFPSARFDHQKHLTQRDVRGDAACLSCHPADVATTSAELLIPDIDNCVACHADQRHRGADRVVLNCVNCHDYHPPRLGQWGAGL
jgi:predicted CXXCH cytochrome family protein